MRSRTLLCFVAMVICSCAATAPVRKKEPKKLAPAAEQEFRSAESLAKNGDGKKALPRLKKFTQQNPESESTDKAYFSMAQIYQNSQQNSEALTNYLAILNLPTASPLEGEAGVRAAKIQLRLNQPGEAEKTLERIKNSKLTPEQWVESEKARIEAFSAQKKYVRALESTVALSEKHPSPVEREKFRVQAVDSVDARFRDEELLEIGANDRFGAARAPAKFRYGIVMAEQRQYGRARDYLAGAAELAPGSELAARATRLISQIDSRNRVEGKTVGVVLPLTGKQSGIGYKALHGIQMGLGVFGKKNSGFRLAVIDSEGNPDTARRAVERLVQEDGVVGVIGGLLSKTATAEASKAQELGVPMILLTQRAGATQAGDYVFRNALTSQMQVQKIVETAMEKVGMKNFAILFPNDAYGVEFANLFWDEVRARGGEITGAQPYDPQETDFRGHVQRLVGTYYFEDRADEYKLHARAWAEKNPRRSARQSAPTVEELLPPVVDFDALFIPDSAKAIGQIAPMLAYNNVSGVRLLGTNIWNSPALVSRGQKFVENSIFVDSYLATDASFLASEFYTGFKSTFEEEPGLTEVQAYDSALILRQLIANGASTRGSLRERLAGLQNFSGAIGQLSVNSDREILRPLSALTINSGRIESFEGSRR